MDVIRHSPEREKRTIRAMIKLYCRKRHGREALCEGCHSLLDYAFKRIDHCVFGPEKPACNDCTVHCYSPGMREQVKEVMRYSGPRMIYRHPVMTIYHFIK